MTATAEREVPASMRRGFIAAVLAVAIGFVVVGGLIAAFGTGRDRPEGAAEQWLTDAGDATRKGVAADARARVAEHGDATLADRLLPTVDVHGKSAFTSLEVGKATTTAAGVRVPFEVTRRAHGPDQPEQTAATLVLQKLADGWHVVGLVERLPGERLPSEGGEAIAKAPPSLYVGAVGVGVLVTLAIAFGTSRLTPVPNSRE